MEGKENTAGRVIRIACAGVEVFTKKKDISVKT